jgi:hypothetical protein
MSIFQYPGVPPMPFSVSLPPIITQLTSELSAAIWDAISVSQTWGIYNTGGGVLIQADAVVGIDYTQNSRVSDFPVESGGFASYNKVATPYTATISLTRGGSETLRSEFLTAIDALQRGVTLFSVVTPTAVYLNATLEQYRYRRQSTGGVGLITVELDVREVREVSPVFTTTAKVANPAAAAPQKTGRVQATTASKPVEQSLLSKVLS